MSVIQRTINEKGDGSFFIMEGDEKIGEMVISVKGSKLTVHHTEVSEKAQGRGLAKELLNEMVEYARQHDLKVNPLCPYVHA